MEIGNMENKHNSGGKNDLKKKNSDDSDIQDQYQADICRKDCWIGYRNPDLTL